MAVEGRTKNLQLKKHSNSFGSRLHKDLRKNYDAYLLILPALLFYILFCYKPMAGAVIAFKDYIPAKGIWGSPWAGLKHFERFSALTTFSASCATPLSSAWFRL
jgi:ABC-type polysaccharide transport system permease subunit